MNHLATALGRPGRTALLLGLAWLAVYLLWPAGALAGDVQAQPLQAGGDHWFVAPKVKRFMRSHTSYEFGEPDTHATNPLSRLEFPLNSWWGGVDLGLQGPRYRLELGLLAALPGQDDIGAMRDSDWEDAKRPQVTTTYSATRTKLKNSFNLDGKLSVSLRQELSMPAWLDLRPLLGVRWQKFVFIVGDGTQRELDLDPTSPTYNQWINPDYLPSESIWFRQEYLHAYLGLQLTADLARFGLGKPGGGWQASLQGDIAHVWGENRDHHLLREGDRVTTDRTEGYAWHAGLDLRAPVFSWGALVMSADYMYIETRGDQTWMEFGTIMTADYGVRVWSQQMGLSLSLEVPF